MFVDSEEIRIELPEQLSRFVDQQLEQHGETFEQFIARLLRETAREEAVLRLERLLAQIQSDADEIDLTAWQRSLEETKKLVESFKC